MKKPRITGHQLCVLLGMLNFETHDDRRLCHWYFNPKSWTNEKGKTVWTFHAPPIAGGFRSVKGDPWDTRSGQSLLSKGLIEPAFTMVHDDSEEYKHWPKSEVTFYRLTELGRACTE
ncbi:hypothetical protein HNGLIVSP_CDS0060 [Escherichia phage 241]|nr:hypothetical protein SP063_00315 [Salmonella phage FSL SP-063]AGF89015.1 hypothetical protein SP029_00165 [Salmonella phage FSL SP-029]EDW4918055.1 hypothetical protein [Salmonella enterica subsp. enterica]QPI15230.1 hypothetical protein GECvBN6_gp027 [Salmonella phage GEC_vB_N6]QPX74104.1 hypothetical protein [Salmonella phage AR2819]QPX74207.1 hypothetical protein [Salmonella phage FrontPhageNews]QPX74488.1 hypothetical protein Sajous1_62 [Salmonella phage Sajous1]UYL83646.1 hypothetica